MSVSVSPISPSAGRQQRKPGRNVTRPASQPLSYSDQKLGSPEIGKTHLILRPNAIVPRPRKAVVLVQHDGADVDIVVVVGKCFREWDGQLGKGRDFAMRQAQ